MDSLAAPGENQRKYAVKVTTRQLSIHGKSSRIAGGESEDSLKADERDSDEIFIMNNGGGIMKSVDISVIR